MPAFKCKKCQEEYFTFQGDRAACEKCGTVNDALHVRREEGGGGGGLFVGRMTADELNRRLGLPPDPPDPPKGGGAGCVIGIFIVIVIVWVLSR